MKRKLHCKDLVATLSIPEYSLSAITFLANGTSSKKCSLVREAYNDGPKRISKEQGTRSDGLGYKLKWELFNFGTHYWEGMRYTRGPH